MVFVFHDHTLIQAISVAGENKVLCGRQWEGSKDGRWEMELSGAFADLALF